MSRASVYKPKAGETFLRVVLRPDQVALAMMIAERYGIAMNLQGNIKDGFIAEFWPEEMACGADWGFFLADLYQAGIKLPELAEKEAKETIAEGGV